jgi:hypothetical protein
MRMVWIRLSRARFCSTAEKLLLTAPAVIFPDRCRTARSANGPFVPQVLGASNHSSFINSR